MFALFPSFLNFGIPKVISLLVLLGLLVAAIVEFRKGYISRPAIFLNALFLWQLFFGVWASLPLWFQFYLNIGTVVGIVAIVAYFIKQRLPQEFYKFAFILYGSLSIIFAIIIMIVAKIQVF